MNNILPFTTSWMDLGDIMLSEISQREKDLFSYFRQQRKEK